jgi:hypothetical protein
MAKGGKYAGLSESLADIKAALDKLQEEHDAATATPHARKLIDDALRGISMRVTELLRSYDRIEQPKAVFDAADPATIGRFIALALVAQPKVPLSDLQTFYGSGVYALYYRGPFKPYKPISGTETPIYVGKADPEDRNATSPVEQGPKLTGRVMEHRRNIAKATSTLSLADFDCRTLVVRSGAEKQAEDYLIHLFRPVWNREIRILQGFGKHGDAPESRTHPQSPWDVLHPARKWAAGSPPGLKSATEIEADLQGHFAAITIFKTLDEVVKAFIEELKQL